MDLYTDQRNTPRYVIRIPCKMVTSDRNCILVEIKNISQSGFFCIIKDRIIPGSKIQFCLLLSKVHQKGKICGSGSLCVRGTGIVKREKKLFQGNAEAGFGIGVQFDSFEPEGEKVLLEFLNSQLNEKAGAA